MGASSGCIGDASVNVVYQESMKPLTTITLNCQVRQSMAEPIRRDMAHEKVVNIYTSLDLTLAHAFF